MVNVNAVKAALLVSVGLLALFFAGAVIRFASRLASYAAIVLLVVAAGYVAYEVYAGWQKGDEVPNTSSESLPETDVGDDGTERSRSEAQSDVLTDEDIDRELEQIRAQTKERNVETDAES